VNNILLKKKYYFSLLHFPADQDILIVEKHSIESSDGKYVRKNNIGEEILIIFFLYASTYIYAMMVPVFYIIPTSFAILNILVSLLNVSLR
jgi:ferric iron reductase protein FhuF